MAARESKKPVRERVSNWWEDIQSRRKHARETRELARTKIATLEADLAGLNEENMRLWREYNTAAEEHQAILTETSEVARLSAEADPRLEHATKALETTRDAFDRFSAEKETVIATKGRELKKWRDQLRAHRFIAAKRKLPIETKV